MWRMENTPEAKALKKRNAHRREWAKNAKSFESQQRFLLHKLHAVSNKTVSVSHDNLPEALQSQIGHFEEFIYPSSTIYFTPTAYSLESYKGSWPYLYSRQ